jgi:hypothetical protein
VSIGDGKEEVPRKLSKWWIEDITQLSDVPEIMDLPANN